MIFCGYFLLFLYYFLYFLIYILGCFFGIFLDFFAQLFAGVNYLEKLKKSLFDRKNAQKSSKNRKNDAFLFVNWVEIGYNYKKTRR